MNKKLFKKNFVFLILSAITLSTLTSCKKDKKVVLNNNDTDVIEIQLSSYSKENDDDSVFSEAQMWHPTNKRILVLFGYDFNYYPVIDNLKKFLSKKYGLHSEDGLIYPVVYPEGFKHGARFYPSDLFAVLNDDSVEYQGVIILGAPEGTHVALARLQDAWFNQVPFPVISLFPQDDILGIESTCDIVLDKSQKSTAKDETELTEGNSSFFEDAPVILSNVIDYIQAIDTSFDRNSDLLVHVNQALKNNKASNYTDPESGISSVNHFVLN